MPWFSKLQLPLRKSTMGILSGVAPLLFRLITHNIRYAAEPPSPGEEPWPVRAPRIIAELDFNTQHSPESFVCLQEVLHDQLIDIQTGLNAPPSGALGALPIPHGGNQSEWAYIGVGRDDGKEAGEYSPLFYRPAVWELEEWDTVWLSETPNKPSIGWDAASIRIVTIGLFRHEASGQKVVGMCTHLDDQGSTAREKGAELILKKMDVWTAKGNGDRPLPAFLAGDFNSKPGQEVYQVVTDESSPLQDVQLLAARKYGNEKTFTGFHDGGKDTVIDFLFVGPKDESYWTVNTYAVLANKFDDGVYSSDHRAVVADVRLRV